MKRNLSLLISLSIWATGISGDISLNDAYSILTVRAEKAPRSESRSGIKDRVFCGYQGWFRAPGDGSDLGFHHYEKNGKFEPGHCTIDLWPDLSEFDEDEKYPTSFRHKDGSVANVFSSLNPKTVNRHFRWMKEYDIDGAFVQRFATQAKGDRKSFDLLKADNQKLINCREAANLNNRAYALMYDLSGLTDDDFEDLARDWKNLRTRMKLGNDPNDPAYLQFAGKPLVAIWGVGFSGDDRKYTLESAEKFIRLLKHNPEWGGMSVMLGVPYYWREQTRDATGHPGFHQVLQLADIISPWSVGRYHDTSKGASQIVSTQAEDLKWCRQKDIEYLPVLYPGFSWKNLHGGELNAIPRRGGKFLWDQFIATKAAGNQSAYIAMFDEIDEATAIFKCTNQPPVGKSEFLTYENLPTDHYLWLCREGRRLLNDQLPER